MSYDLYFHAAEPVDVLDVRQYFAARDHYQVGDDQVVYENPDTGVYFTLDLGSHDEGEEDDDEELEIDPEEASRAASRVPVAFNINYFRPHVFGLEAEPELTAFVRQFGLAVDDPQHDGMGVGAYSPEGFLRGWDAGNEFGHRAFLQHGAGEGPIPSLPRAELERWWSWNLCRQALMADFEVMLDGGFVPTIFFFLGVAAPDAVTTAVVWGDCIPIAIPTEVDVVILVGEALPAPRFVRRADLDPVLAEFEVVAGGARRLEVAGRARTVQAAYRNVFYEDDPPAGLWERVLACPALELADEGPARLAPDRILTREVLEAASR